MAELQVQYIDPQELKPFADNPRHHSERNIQDIQRSIKKFGFTNPILVRQEDNMVVAGHGRLQSAQELGLEEVPVIYLDFSENDAKLYAITDNRTAETSEWDLVALDELVQSLEMDEDELPDTGFYADELEEILAEVQEDVDLYADKDADAVPEEVEPVTRPGDLWLIGQHRLLCGDSTRAEDLAKLLDGQSVDLILSDPPYCSGGFQETGKSGGSVGTSATHKQIANDRLSTRGYSALLKSAFSNLSAPYIYVFTDWRMWVYLFDIVESTGYGVRSMIVWDKGSPGMGRGWRSQHELIMWGAKETPPFDKHAPGVGNVISASRTGNKLHTTEKPVELLVELLDNVPFCSTVYDPFIGSGTTLIAAQVTGRQCYGLELDPHYCDVVVQRYADFVESTQDITLVRDGQELSYESVS